MDDDARIDGLVQTVEAQGAALEALSDRLIIIETTVHEIRRDISTATEMMGVATAQNTEFSETGRAFIDDARGVLIDLAARVTKIEHLMRGDYER